MVNPDAFFSTTRAMTFAAGMQRPSWRTAMHTRADRGTETARASTKNAARARTQALATNTP